MKLGIFIFLTVIQLQAAEYYAAPNSHGNGSFNNPWDLQHALHQPHDLKPGDTLWLRGGIYQEHNRPTKFTSALQGNSSRPITVRQYPDERAIIDGNLSQKTGGFVNYIGFEILNSNLNRYTAENGPFPQAWWGEGGDLCVSGLDIEAPGVKAINLLIHDCIGGGIGVNVAARNAEIYGCLIYYNGWQGGDRGHGHGIYGQNANPSTKTVMDNLVFQNLALGMQLTGSGNTPVADNLHLEGTAFFMNGHLARSHQANLLIGAFEGMGQNITLIDNCVYDTDGSSSDSNIGYAGGLNNVLLQGNYFSTSVMFGNNQNMTLTGNTFASDTHNLDRQLYPNNTYGQPTSNKIIVHPNEYESGRANIIIYNWELKQKVSVDISKAGLPIGTPYELHNAADYRGDISRGVYSGTPITVSMTNHTVAKPIGTNFKSPASTFPQFGAFVLVKK